MEAWKNLRVFTFVSGVVFGGRRIDGYSRDGNSLNGVAGIFGNDPHVAQIDRSASTLFGELMYLNSNHTLQ